MARREYTGGSAETTLNGALGASATTINITDGTGWPTGSTGPFSIDIDFENSSYEKVLVLSRTGNVLDVDSASDRGYDGTSDTSHLDNATVRHVATSVDMDEANAHINNVGAVLHTSAALGTDSVTATQIAAGAVDTAELATDAVTTAKITDGNVTLAKMAANSVDSDQYVDGSIDTAHYAALSVDSAALGADAVADGTKIADNAVDSEHITAGAIDLAHMSVNSIDSDQYVDGSIDTAHFAAGAVTNAETGFTWTTWTPQVFQTINKTSTNTRSRYLQLGNLVIASFNLTMLQSQAAAALQIHDLPVVAADINFVMGVARYGVPGTNQYTLFASGVSGQTERCQFFTTDSNTDSFGVTMASGHVLTGLIVYESA